MRPDRVADRERRGAEVEQGQVEHPPPPGPEQDADRAADRAAVPDQPRAREEVAEQVVGDLVVVLDEVVEPGADDPADEGGEDHLVGPVGRLAELLQALADQRSGGDEPEREHDPEGLQGERADVDLGLHGGGGELSRIAPAGIEPASLGLKTWHLDH